MAHRHGWCSRSLEHRVPGAAEFVETLKASGKPFLVLTGISTMETIEQFPFRPSTVVNGIADLIPVAQTGQI